MNYYEHHIGDYAEATAHLSFVEDAAYTRLIRKYYASEKPLPTDQKAVQRLIGARSKEEREAVATVLDEFFTLEEDGWHNRRCDEEIARYREGDAEREQKNAHEKERMRRHREERSRLFSELREFGITPKWDTPVTQLRDILKRTRNAPETRTGALHEFVNNSQKGTFLEKKSDDDALSEKNFSAKDNLGIQKNPEIENDVYNKIKDLDKPATRTGVTGNAPATANHTPDTNTHTPDTNTHTPDTNTHINKNTHSIGLPTRAGAVCVALRAEGLAQVNPSHPDLIALLDDGAEIHEFVSAARIALAKGKGFAYVIGIVRSQRSDANRMAEQAKTKTKPGANHDGHDVEEPA